MTLLLAVVALFGAGLAGSLSPCVLPLLPGYLGVLADGGAGGRVRRTLLFCASAVGTFVVLGTVVAAIGASVSFASSTSQRLAGAVLLTLGVASWVIARGWWSPRVPVVERALRLSPGPRAVALGVGCAAAWSPCVGPLLGAALTAAGGSGSVLRGAVLLASFGAGVVSPLLAVSLLPTPAAPDRVRRVGRAMSGVVPLLLAAVGLLLLTGLYDGLIQRSAMPV